MVFKTDGRRIPSLVCSIHIYLRHIYKMVMETSMAVVAPDACLGILLFEPAQSFHSPKDVCH